MYNKLPILVLAFNRADYVQKSMSVLQEYKPERVYLACDGARLNKPNEQTQVLDTRRKMLEMINWHCEVKTLFQPNNLGCAKAVNSAINWFFEQEEAGIIIEDDVVVSIDFIKMCEELLPRYANDDKIQQISSQYYGLHNQQTNVYTFNKKPYIWGWATWKRSWQKYMDMDMTLWSNFRMSHILFTYGIFQTLMMYYYWKNTVHNINTSSSWATRWHFAAVANDLLSVCPRTNLAINIGCSNGNGTHYQKDAFNPYEWLKMGTLSFPLKHPSKIKLDRKQVAIDNFDFFRIRILGALHKIMAKINNK